MPINTAKAIIWDMDGVIADTAAYHFKAWQETFQQRGVNFTEEDFRHNFGQRNDNIIRSVLGKGTTPAEIDTIANEKEESFRNKAKHHLKPFPGVADLMKSLYENGFKMAIASSAPIENIELIIHGLGVNSCFQSIVSSKDVIQGKPDPQTFLLAAKTLGVKPKDCIVIEDAIAGVTAAKRAGMHCLAVTNTHPKTSLAEADLVVDTLETITVSNLEGLLILT